MNAKQAKLYATQRATVRLVDRFGDSAIVTIIAAKGRFFETACGGKFDCSDIVSTELVN